MTVKHRLKATRNDSISNETVNSVNELENYISLSRVLLNPIFLNLIKNTQFYVEETVSYEYPN